ncbi:MAG TPA: TetR/AcrR family transcriptional regulator [Bordetella sp.]
MPEKLSHKERTHARIVEAAASAMREHGWDGIGVAALMKRAGLTHGGFYAHFASRDELVEEAVDCMFKDTGAMLERCLHGKDGASGLAALIDFYLSDRLRKSVDRGCPLPGLTGEASRMPAAARARFDRGVRHFRQAITAALTDMGRDDAQSLASSVLAEMIGAMSLARATPEEKEGRDILHASRERLKERLGLA